MPTFIIDIGLSIAFLTGITLLVMRVYYKLPALNEVSDDVITGQFQNDSAKLRLTLFHLGTFYRNKYARRAIRNILAKALYRFHVVLFRFDNIIVRMFKWLRVPANAAEKEPTIGQSGASSPARVHELNSKKKDSGER